MAKTKKLIRIICGIIIGVFSSQFFFSNKDSAALRICASGSTDFKKNYEEKNQNSNVLFVGVMTASRYLDSRAVAAYETWGKEIPGKIVFYSSEKSRSDRVPLVALEGVDDRYPPQKKSFMMLKHMHDNYLDQYEWFMRADDDVYVRPDRLEELLRSVDSNKPWFIGQTGRGNTEEFGMLSLESDENFCMGGPGVIFSRETLMRVAPHVEECLRNLVTTHEDVEVGRCVSKFAGISCTWSYEMQVILYHNQSGESAFTGNLKQKEVHRAITMHPVKQSKSMFRLHKYVKGLKIQREQYRSLILHRDIAMSIAELGYQKRNDLHSIKLAENVPLYSEPAGSSGYLGDTKLLGVPSSINRYVPKTLEDVQTWELIAKTLFSANDFNPKKRIGSAINEGLGDIIREVMDLINSFSKQRGRIIDFKEILYGYWRLDPLHGVDLILDILLVYKKYRGHKMTIQVRRHAYVQQTFTDIYIKERNSENISSASRPFSLGPVPSHIVNKLISLKENLQPYFSFGKQDDQKTINFILPISGKFEVFKIFLNNYEEICLQNFKHTSLFIILYKNKNTEEDFHKSLSTIRDMQNKYKDSKIRVLEIAEEFARGKALQHGVDQLSSDDLMLFIDVDISFGTESLTRIRRNTVQSQCIYFPIVFSQYSPKLLNRTKEYSSVSEPKSDDIGFWRQFGFGIVSLYKSDYLHLGGFNLLIAGWGFEDVNFYDNVIKSNLSLVRTVDPSLVHIYHAVTCDSSLDNAQKNMCLGTQASTLGSLNQLQQYYKKYKFLFR